MTDWYWSLPQGLQDLIVFSLWAIFCIVVAWGIYVVRSMIRKIHMDYNDHPTNSRKEPQ